MWVTSRDPDKAARAVELGADEVFRTGERLPERVDAVMETVVRRPGNTRCGRFAQGDRRLRRDRGRSADTELSRIYFLQLRVLGSTMGTRQELERLLTFCARTGVRPVVDRVLPLKQARQGFAALERGEVFGKVVLTP